MGSEITVNSVKSTAAEPLWERYREQFPVRRNLIYLNHAAVAPLCRPAAEAMQPLAEDCMRFGSLHYDEWLDAYDGLRRAAARLIHADAAEIEIGRASCRERV